VTALGLFVGGRSARMGGAPKGLLPAPDTGEALVARSLRLARALGLDVTLVGDATPYRALVGDVAPLDDEAPGSGPLGGLCALLAWAGERPVIALACDMPRVSLAHLGALRDHPSRDAVVAARRAPDAPWEPLLARYDAARVLPAARARLARGERSLQGLLAAVGAADAGLDAGACDDWDTPEDVTRSRTP
jgi:molybdopterin-guanine dinucleotide biosynthesis protein A